MRASMGNISGSAVHDAGHRQSGPLFATLLEDHDSNAALCGQDPVLRRSRRPALCQLQLTNKHKRQDCQTTDEMIAEGIMQRDERSPDNGCRQKLMSKCG